MTCIVATNNSCSLTFVTKQTSNCSVLNLEYFTVVEDLDFTSQFCFGVLQSSDAGDSLWKF